MTVFQLYAMAPANFSVSLLIHGLYSQKNCTSPAIVYR